jgi:hypothetical protein
MQRRVPYCYLSLAAAAALVGRVQGAFLSIQRLGLDLQLLVLLALWQAARWAPKAGLIGARTSK